MSKKEIVLEFLAQNNGQLTSKNAWDAFSSINGVDLVKKTSFNFYRNEAEKSGAFTPLENTPTQTTSKIATLSTNVEVKEFETKTIDVDNIDKVKFTALKTDTAFDKLVSKRDGFMKGSNYLVTGESGAGKTTLCTNLVDYLKENNPELSTGFISGEMDEDDWTEECLDNNRLANLETLFILEWVGESNYMDILEKGLTKWDVIILDSFEVVLDQIKDVMGWTTKKAEGELINMIRKVCRENGTIILAIQQYTKSGSYVGSTKIKHMLTGIMYVKFDSNGDRYVYFDKNRKGGHMIHKHLYFTKNKENGRIEFNRTRFENEQKIGKMVEEESSKIEEESGFFDEEILSGAKIAEERRQSITEITSTHEVEMRDVA